MPVKKSAPKDQNLTVSEITQIVGGAAPILPGESAQDYQSGLTSTIAELEAKTHLQVYLAQKIFDCVWWIRRLEAQKRSAILNKMAEELVGYRSPDATKIFQLMDQAKWDDPKLKAALLNEGCSSEELLVRSMKYEGQFIQTLDRQIADRIKAMRDLQTSYEALVNRKAVAERLRIQNELMVQSLNPPSLASLSIQD
jgi:hypothetical protein